MMRDDKCSVREVESERETDLAGRGIDEGSEVGVGKGKLEWRLRVLRLVGVDEVVKRSDSIGEGDELDAVIERKVSPRSKLLGLRSAGVEGRRIRTYCL